MTGTTAGPVAGRLVAGAGLLGQFCAAGVLAAADVHVADRLGRIGGEPDERVLLAVALAVRGTRQGSVVLDLSTAEATIAPDEDAVSTVVSAAASTVASTVASTAASTEVGAGAPPLAWPELEEWIARCAVSPLVGAAPGRPLRMAGTRLWLTRYWRQEEAVAAEIGTRLGQGLPDLDEERLRADLHELFDDIDDADQRAAAATAATSRVGVIAGGPGTGKTTTVARLLAVLLRQRPGLRVALAAPTGKAAARLQEAVQGARARLSGEDLARLAPLEAATLHRLLGPRPGRPGRFRHDRENRLPFDVVVVDESSMISLTMMARLLEALPAAARLVLVGDPDQLASVEAGAVLGDLVPEGPDAPLRASVSVLRRVRRFGERSSIAELADAIRRGDADTVLGLLRAGSEGVAFHPVPDDEPPSGPALTALHALAAGEAEVMAAARLGDASTALDLLERHRLLCAHRTGPRGERYWSDALERWLAAADPALVPRLDGRYAGQPLLVTANDYENGLYNGDIGVVVEHGGALAAAFRRGGGTVVLPLVRLGDLRPLHALTVHRAQGSQFRSVTVLLPPASSPLATRQTFYTAVTRATTNVAVIGSAEAVEACVRRPVTRATGLRDRLAGRL